MSRPPRTRAVKRGLDHPGGRAGDSALRHTGIRFMGDMPWGTHACVFYETPQDLLDTAVCYFETGLKSNEFCVWAVSDPISLPQAEKALRRAVPGSDRHRAAGQIELISGSEWYLNGRTLGISPRTVDFHSANLLKKLGARNAADLVHKVLGE